MSYLQMPHPWNPRYAIPDYVQAEPPGRGAYTTAWLPRGTIDGLVPDYLAKPIPSSAAMGFTVGGVAIPNWALLGAAAVGAGLLIRRMRRRRR